MINLWTVEDGGLDALKAEARHLRSGPSDTDRRLGLWVSRYDFKCPGDADEVLRKARDVMEIINDVSLAISWPTDAELSCRLPPWFVEACEPEDIEDKGEDEVTSDELSLEERRAQHFAERWKLSEWTYWMAPAERVWLWWSADVRDSNTIHVVVDRLGDPPPGPPPGLCWLFAASGAVSYDEA